jgi:hypothetical protein
MAVLDQNLQACILVPVVPPIGSMIKYVTFLTTPLTSAAMGLEETPVTQATAEIPQLPVPYSLHFDDYPEEIGILLTSVSGEVAREYIWKLCFSTWIFDGNSRSCSR